MVTWLLVEPKEEFLDGLLTDAVLRGMWEHCFQRAKRYAERETGRSLPGDPLSWHDVFEAEYRLPEEVV
jgi:hypothetical protein